MNDTIKQEMYDLKHSDGLKPKEITEIINKKYGLNITSKQCSDYIRRFKKNSILEDYGFNKNDYSISNIHYNKNGEMSFGLRKKKDSLELDEVVSKIINGLGTKQYRKEKRLNGRHLTINLADMHFPVLSLDEASCVILKVKDLLDKEDFKTVNILQLGDLTHSNLISATQTVSGTILEDEDNVKGLHNALEFMYDLVDLILSYGVETHYYSVEGNHSQMPEYVVMNVLKNIYPDLNVHDTYTQRNGFIIGDNGVMIQHGDLGSKRTLETFISQFPDTFNYTKNRFVISGHIHHEVIKDLGGVRHISAPTLKPSDKWEKKNGFVGSDKACQLLVFGEGIEEIHYVRS